jgi:hypothetical protein
VRVLERARQWPDRYRDAQFIQWFAIKPADRALTEMSF